MKLRFVFILLFSFRSLIFAQTHEAIDAELIKDFMNDFLHSTSRYTYSEFLDDSTELAKDKSDYIQKIKAQKIEQFQYDTIERTILDTSLSSLEEDFHYYYILRLHNKIDTCFGNFRIPEEKKHKCFNNILVRKEPMWYFGDNEYEKLTKFLTSDSINFFHETSYPYNISYKNPFDTIFTLTNYRINKSWVSWDSLLNDVSTISYDEIQEIIAKSGRNYFLNDYLEKNSFNRIYYFSVPLFNKDKTFAYMAWQCQCGDMCGYGFKGIFKKINTHWVPVDISLLWVS